MVGIFLLLRWGNKKRGHCILATKGLHYIIFSILGDTTRSPNQFFMIRKERAEFLDNVLRLFDGKRTIRKQELEMKYKEDSYIFYQTEKHLKILEADGMIMSNGLDEYHLQPQGVRVLNDIENLGYLARHKLAAAEAEDEEDEEREETSDTVLSIIIILILFFLAFNFDSCFK